MRSLLLAALGLSLISAPSEAAPDEATANWPQWRGPGGTGVARVGNPPLEWGENENIAWKAVVPGKGKSTPIVWGDRVFLLTAIDTGERQGGSGSFNVLQYVVLALDAQSGRVVWRRTAREAQPNDGTHADGTWGSMSAATDGERVIASFGSAGIYSYTFDGEPEWSVDLGDMKTFRGFGEGSSPALHADRLVVNWDHEGPSFVVALDKRSGVELWRTARNEGTSWSTPLVIEQDGRAQVITSATRRVRSYDLESGALIWEAEGMTANTIPTPVHQDGIVYATSGYRGNALLAVRLAGASGDVTGTGAVIWSLGQDTPYVPSPLVYGDTLYFLKSNSGVLTCVDPSDGTKHFGPQRLDVSNVYASPVGVQDRAYITGRDGHTVVLRRGATYEVLAVNELNEAVDASLAIAGRHLLAWERARLQDPGSGRHGGMMRGLTATLAVSVLASGVPADERDISKLRPGALLFASPELAGSVFESSVILLTHHDTTGSAGVIINQPTDVRISEVIELEDTAESSLPLYIGGPVTPRVITALAKLAVWREGTLHIIADLYLVREVETLSRLLTRRDAERTVRVYAGYAGWGAQQLAGEVRLDT